MPRPGEKDLREVAHSGIPASCFVIHAVNIHLLHLFLPVSAALKKEKKVNGFLGAFIAQGTGLRRLTLNGYKSTCVWK